nr:retrovirus-related Pol polyprotein from transposon TNT 1-94 [Tanacetum cinerariifolium]
MEVLLDLDESSSSTEETVAEKRIEKANQQRKDLENQNNDLQDKYDVLINQVNTFEEQNNEFNEQMKVLNEKNADLLAQTKVLQDQLKVKHVLIDTHTECQAQYAKLEEERYEYMIRYSALFDNDKQNRKKIDEQEILFDKMSFENPSYFEKAKDLRPSLYDEKVIGLGYTLMFLIHSDETLEIKKFERARENKIEFAYDYGNPNASYVNEKINFSDDYFQEIINPDFGKIYSLFQQTSSLKQYVSNVILEKIIIDLEDKVVSLLEKEKENLKTIKSLKSKGFESSENAIFDSENQSENDCQVVEIECDNVENPKVIALGMFKLNVSQSVSPIFVTKTSCDSKNVENLYTFSNVRRPKKSSVIWKEKGSSNTYNVDLSSISHSKLNKNVKRYSRKDLSCNNSHFGETSSAYVCNDAMNVSCNSMMYDLFNENDLFIFDDESVRISPVSKMPFKKKPRDSLNVRFKRNSNQYLPRTMHRWLPKMKPLAEPVAKWIPRIVQVCLWIIDSGCSKHMTGNRTLLINFVEKFLGTVRFGNNDFAMIAGYRDVVIGSMTINKVYYVEGLGHNLFSVGKFCDKGLEVSFQKSTCFVRNENGVDLLTGDRSSNLYTISLNEVASNSSTCLLAKASSSQS